MCKSFMIWLCAVNAMGPIRKDVLENHIDQYLDLSSRHEVTNTNPDIDVKLKRMKKFHDWLGKKYRLKAFINAIVNLDVGHIFLFI